MWLCLLFLWITLFSLLTGEKVTCSLKGKFSCFVLTFKPDCEPQHMVAAYPSMFGSSMSGLPSHLLMNLRSKIVSEENGTIGIMLVWQQYFKSHTPRVQGFQITMKGRDGIDTGKSRCFILQIQNKSSISDSYLETFYLIIKDIQPTSNYSFILNNLPRSNAVWHVNNVLTTKVYVGYEEIFHMFSANWNQYIECLYNWEKDDLEIYIELPPNDFHLVLFEVNLFNKDNLDDIDTLTINSSNFIVYHDKSYVYKHGYIILTYSMVLNVKIVEVWVTPIDDKGYSPSECLCYLRNRHCSACPTATTSCLIDKDVMESMTQNKTLDQVTEPQRKADLIAWLCVGGLVISASICSYVMFRRRHSFCTELSRCTSGDTGQPEVNQNNECLSETTPSLTLQAIPETDQNSDILEASLPLVDSYINQHTQSDLYIRERTRSDLLNHQRTQSDLHNHQQTQSVITLTDSYISFIPPDSSYSNLSKSLSEQMLDVNREVLPTRGPTHNFTNSDLDVLSETKSLDGESIYQ